MYPIISSTYGKIGDSTRERKLDQDPLQCVAHPGHFAGRRDAGVYHCALHDGPPR